MRESCSGRGAASVQRPLGQRRQGRFNIWSREGHVHAVFRFAFFDPSQLAKGQGELGGRRLCASAAAHIAQGR